MESCFIGGELLCCCPRAASKVYIACAKNRGIKKSLKIAKLDLNLRMLVLQSLHVMRTERALPETPTPTSGDVLHVCQGVGDFRVKAGETGTPSLNFQTVGGGENRMIDGARGVWTDRRQTVALHIREIAAKLRRFPSAGASGVSRGYCQLRGNPSVCATGSAGGCVERWSRMWVMRHVDPPVAGSGP
jgi:hypothetical protein